MEVTVFDWGEEIPFLGLLCHAVFISCPEVCCRVRSSDA